MIPVSKVFLKPLAFRTHEKGTLFDLSMCAETKSFMEENPTLKVRTSCLPSLSLFEVETKSLEGEDWPSFEFLFYQFQDLQH